MAAQSCIAPGFTTILYILTNSISEKVVKGLFNFNTSSWIQQYLHGATQEIYEIILDSKYEGMKFSDAAIAIYKHHEALFFAVGRNLKSGEIGTFGSEQTILFCPFGMILEGGERAYLITGTSRSANRVGRFEFNTPNAFQSSFWSDFDVMGHLNKHKVAQESGKINLNIGMKASNPDFPSGSSISLEPMPATIRSLTQKGKFDFTVLKQKKEGGTEEIAPLLPNSPAIDLDVITPLSSEQSFVLGQSLPRKIEKHYLYCILGTYFPSNLIYFVAPIRQKDKISPIVFLCQHPPAPEDWEMLEDFKEIYYIIGSPLLRRDLRKAKVMKAIRTICFADPAQMNVTDRAADSSILLTLMNIQAMSRSDDEYANFVTVEFIHTQNMKLIGNYNQNIREGAASEVLEFDMQNIIPAFAGGHVFSSSMFHSILCQAFYEHNLIPVLKMFLFDGGANSKKKDEYSDTEQELPASFFFQVELPLDGRFTGLPFGTLFTLLMTRYQIMAIGLYRQSVNEANGKKFQYVYLNPDCTTLIDDDDLIFAIGVEKPEWN